MLWEPMPDCVGGVCFDRVTLALESVAYLAEDVSVVSGGYVGGILNDSDPGFVLQDSRDGFKVELGSGVLPVEAFAGRRKSSACGGLLCRNGCVGLAGRPYVHLAG